MTYQIKIGDQFTTDTTYRPYVVKRMVRFAGEIRFVCQREGENYSLLLTTDAIRYYQMMALDACIIY